MPESPLSPDPKATSTGVGGADDNNSGGGNASGTPDADTGMRAEAVINRGDVVHDRAKLFPTGQPRWDTTDR